MPGVSEVTATVSATTAGPLGPVSIPVSRYTSPEFARRENDRLWPRVWQLACTLDHVARPGDWYEYRAGGFSIVVVRGDDGELRAFQNACRHRGSALCEGAGSDLAEIRCPFHRWTWDLRGRLREVPSRREFGVLNDDLPLIAASVGVWGPLVFVNFDPHAAPLAEFLDPVPADCAWADLDSFHCVAMVSIPARCNWKTLIDGFSETYHVQGIHREMLPMCDDVNGPQEVWARHGKLEQPYGLPSPRLRERPDDQQVWDHFVQIMGNRVGRDLDADAGPAPAVGPGRTMRDEIADIIRARARERGLDYSHFTLDQTLNMSQYNLFPNVTVLVFSDMLNVVRARARRNAPRRVHGRLHLRAAPAVGIAAHSAVRDGARPGPGSPARHRAQPGPRELRPQPARHAPTRPHPPHGLADRGVPDRQPAPQPRGLPRDLPHGAARAPRGGATDMTKISELWRYPVKSMQGERIETAAVTETGLAGDRAYAVIDVATGKVGSAKHPRLWGALLECRARFVAPPSPDTPRPAVAITLPDGSETGSDDPDVDARLSALFARPVQLTTVAPAGNAYLGVWPEIDGVMPDDYRQLIAVEGDEAEGTLTELGLAMAAPAGTFFDVSALHVVTTATLRGLTALQPASRFAVERYRPNVVIDGFDEPFVENGWTGTDVRLGATVTATVLLPTMRCIMTTLPQGDLPRDNAVLRTVAQHNRIEIPGLGTWSCVGAYAAVTASGPIALGDPVTLPTP